MPDLDSIPDDILQRAKLLYINYPNNPTGAIANRKFFEDVVAFAKQHHIIVIHDAAYASVRAVQDQAIYPLSAKHLLCLSQYIVEASFDLARAVYGQDL